MRIPIQAIDNNKQVVEIRPVKPELREGWAVDSARVAETGEDELFWPEFANDEDASLQTMFAPIN